MDRTENQRVRYVLIVLQKLCHRKSNRNGAALTVFMQACQAITRPAESSTVVIAIARISLLKVSLTTDKFLSITSFLKTPPFVLCRLCVLCVCLFCVPRVFYVV